jgi:sensor histidine kinase YesM
MTSMETPLPRLPNSFQPRSGESGLLRGAGTLLVCVAGVLGLATAIECHAGALRGDAHAPVTPSIAYGAVLWLSWALIGQLLWRASRRWPAVLSLSWKAIALQVVIAAMIATVHLFALQSTVTLILRLWPGMAEVGYDSLRFFNIGRFSLDLLLYAILWTAGVMVSMQLSAQKDALHTLELRQQLSEAHLRALQMQLEPHFLFNTLNAITTLVDLGRNAEASETLAHLNFILKATLARARPEKVPLATELEIVENYLAIEQLRYADRLRVEIKIDPQALPGLVPCFLLQPIIENAIRHGISHVDEHGLIVTTVERNADRLCLCVRDNGPGLQLLAQPGHGIGLKNTRERLAHFYPSCFDMRVNQPASGGFEVSISIPYEHALG